MPRKPHVLYEDSYDKLGCIKQKNLSAHLHYHAELILSMKGGFDAVIDGVRYEVKEGMGLIVFPYQMHEYIERNSERAIVLLLNPERNMTLAEYFKKRLPTSPLIPRELIDDEIRSAAESMLKYAWSRYDPGNEGGMIVAIYKELVFALILKRLSYEPFTPSELDSMRNVLFWCQEHFTEPVTIPMAAKALFISESQLSHIFSSRIHVGFRDYINSLRVQAATIMLTETDKPVSEIAMDCGFASFSTFNRAFRKSTGSTPREIRARGKQ